MKTAKLVVLFTKVASSLVHMIMTFSVDFINRDREADNTDSITDNEVLHR